MDNLLEIIVPLIFAAIYFFGNMVSGKKEEDDASPLAPRPSPGGGDEEAAERQRRIQEEIRRKIMERRRANSGEGPAPMVVPPLREAPAERPRASREWDGHEHGAAPQSGANVFWDQSDDTYTRGIEERMRQIEATRRQAEQLRQRAEVARRKTTQWTRAARSGAGTGTYFSGTVRQNLKDPAAARAAFIYGEVLGRPVGMRDASSSQVPGLVR